MDGDEYKGRVYLSKVLAPLVMTAIKEHLLEFKQEPSPERSLEAVITLMTALGGVVSQATATYYTEGEGHETLRIELSDYILDCLECAWIPDRSDKIEAEIETADNVIKFPGRKR